MKQKSCRFFARLFLLFLIGLLWAGCTGQPTTQPTTVGSGYAGALTADYDGALDVATQLALGTIRLEETSDAVTAEQASLLLPLWQSLQGSVIQGDGERSAVFKQIERTMTDAQLEAIRAMQLTQADLGGLGPGEGAFPQGGTRSEGQTRPQGMTRQGQGNLPEGQGFDPNMMATRRAEIESMSDEERRQMFEQFRQGGAAAGGSALNMVVANVVRLLSERSGQAMVLPTNTSAPPTETPSPTAAPTQTPTQAVVPTSTPTAAPTAESTSTPQAAPAEAAVTPTASPASVSAPAATPTSQSVVVPVPTLVQVEDTDPGPPFTVEVSSNTAVQDPLVEESRIYKITGLVRNEGTQTYDISAIHVTFFDADGFRGSYRKFPQLGTGGEWIWHGRTEAAFGCLLLGPGQSCPFVIEIAAQNMASFLIHPDAVVTTREPVPVELSDIQVIQDGTGLVRFTGTATNRGTVNAKNVTVEGTLLNANGQIVSVGSTVILQEDIMPGETVSFDLRIEKQVYHSYQLYVQAERDWD